MGEKEKEYVSEAFLTNWVAPLGPNVDIFERQLSDYLGVKGAVSLNSGTAALHLSLISIGIKPGDVVLCQSFTFAASAFPIVYMGANPVFIDSEQDTWNMDTVLLEKAIVESIEKGQKPAAIIVVHLYGMPAKMDSIVSISDKYQIPIIEDAAEALGSSYHNKKCGSFGDVSIVSFNGNKIITTSGGGALISNNEDWIQKTRHLSAQAKDAAPYYLHTQIGYNYRMSNICAGIGRGQMEVLQHRVARRREIFELYVKELGNIEGVSFQKENEASFSNRWLTTMLLDEEKFGIGMNDNIRIELEKCNIESRPLWKPLHQQPVFENCVRYINGVSDKLFSTGICLPSGSNNDNEVIDTVINQIKKVILK